MAFNRKRKGREFMKTKKYCLILAVFTGILCFPAVGQIELPRPIIGDLVGQAHPTLTGIEKLYVDITARVAEPNRHGLIWKEIGAKVKHEIIEAGIKITNANEGRYAHRPLFVPQLRVDIDMIVLNDSQDCVFRTQTSLYRAVHLRKQQELLRLFKAEVWKTKPIMQAVPIENMPAKVTEVVLKQVDAFIEAWHAANSKVVQSIDSNQVSINQREPAKPPATVVATKYLYVASKNSEVFHKSDCRWAKRIAPKNLVRYKTREDAINDGKRPCKMCKP